MSNLSQHFTLAEATASQTASRLGIDNTIISNEVLTAASKTAMKMEKVRLILDSKPINVSSWIRVLELNRALGSSDSSQHLKGEAVDFICPAFGSPLEVCKKIVENETLIGFDQLILEHTWVHISWKSTPGSQQRRQVLSLLAGGKFASGLTDRSGKSLTA